MRCTPSSTSFWTPSPGPCPPCMTTWTPPAPTSWPSPPFPARSGDRSGPTTPTSGSIARSAAAPTSSGSFPTATPSSVWSVPSWPNNTTNGPKAAATSAWTSWPAAGSPSCPATPPNPATPPTPRRPPSPPSDTPDEGSTSYTTPQDLTGRGDLGHLPADDRGLPRARSRTWTAVAAAAHRLGQLPRSRRTHRSDHTRPDAEEAGRRRAGLLRPPRNLQWPHRGAQRTPRTSPRLRARVPQPDQLHRQITVGDRRVQAPPTP